MKLETVFNQLATGELSQLSIGGKPAGVIDDTNYEKILPHIELGLTALYKRFAIKRDRLVIELQPGQTMYELDSKYALSNKRSRELVRYIIDTPEYPFKDNMQKVEQVISDHGFGYSVNDNNSAWSIKTPRALLLEVPAIFLPWTVGNRDIPDRMKTRFLTVHYRALPDAIKVCSGYVDLCRVEIDLEVTHLEALLYYVASRVHNPVGMTNEFHTGNSYYAKYEAACQELERLDIGGVDQGGHNTNFRRNGWV